MADDPLRPADAQPAPLDRAALLKIFSALSQPSRLAVFRAIVAAGPAGATVQSLGEALHITGSALTLHLRVLEAAGLAAVDVRRRTPQSPTLVARVDACTRTANWFLDQCRAAGWPLPDTAETPAAPEADPRGQGRAAAAPQPNPQAEPQSHS